MYNKTPNKQRNVITMLSVKMTGVNMEAKNITSDSIWTLELGEGGVAILMIGAYMYKPYQSCSHTLLLRLPTLYRTTLVFL